MNIKLLKSKMLFAGDSQVDLAKHLGLSCNSMSQKMTGKVQFKAEEIGKIVWKYDLTAQETHDIFFAKGVTNLETSHCS